MGRYRRTVSFPNPPTLNLGPRGPTAKSYHVRSASLPCNRTHPLIPQLRDLLSQLRAWEWAQIGPGSGSIVDGLARLKGVLDSFDDALQLPLTQDSLSSRTDVVEKLLEDFLRFVDAYGIFQESMLSLKQEVASAQMGLRRKDDSKLAQYIKAQKKTASEVIKLISGIGSIPESPSVGPIEPTSVLVSDYDDELGQIIGDVHRIILTISEAVFSSVSGSFGPTRRPIWAILRLGKKLVKKDEQGIMIEEFQKVIVGVEGLLELRKNCKGEKKKSNEEAMRMGVLKGMQELENCIGLMEKESEKVFRSLISTRVSLLNILTHA